MIKMSVRFKTHLLRDVSVPRQRLHAALGLPLITLITLIYYFCYFTYLS